MHAWSRGVERNRRHPRRFRAGLQVLALLVWASCRTLPHDLSPTPSASALPPSPGGAFAELEEAVHARFGGDRSGFLLLDRNQEALRWRLALADTATQSLDVQYFLWYEDASGELLAEAVMRAADRGVRVRVLVDDLLLFDRDRDTAAIDAHPHVEIRIFNPWRERSGGAAGRVVEFLGRTQALNSRMHNKLMVADNRIAICGGRNVGDMYFGLSEHSNFHDMDLLAVGPAARELSHAFDAYWNAEAVVTGGALERRDLERLARLRAERQKALSAEARLTGLPREPADWSQSLRELPPRLLPGVARAVYDLPGPGGAADAASLRELSAGLERAREEILVESAYWIPDAEELEFLRKASAKGVRIRILTNSLASHDVPAVNSAYKKWRPAVLRSGVELYELRPDAALKAFQDTPPVESRFLGLHTKAFVVDDDLVYVGSHNLDPRSHRINLELGLLVESRELAEEVARRIERDMRAENSWRVGLDEAEGLFWEAGETRITRQPARSFWQRVQDAFFGILPIEDQL